MKPSDDELEALAVRLDQSDANEYSYDNDKEEAAAMLRACKGRQSLPRMAPAVGDSIEEMRENGRNDPLWQHGDMQLMWVNEGDVANAAILAALEPAPDHAGWNAGIEAAAKVAQGQYRERSMLDPESPSYGIDMTPDRSDWGRGIQRGREQAAAAIRALKKGQTND